MKIKAVIFDIGQTLVYYPIPLNWSKLYRPAFESIAEKHKLNIKPLLKYIDIPFTSNDAGYRKPSGKGLEILSDKFGFIYLYLQLSLFFKVLQIAPLKYVSFSLVFALTSKSQGKVFSIQLYNGNFALAGD